MLFKLITGIGNPDDKHYNNRHNIGAVAVEQISKNYPGVVKNNIKKSEISGDKIVFCWAIDYVNNTGQKLNKLFSETKLFVFIDDLETPLGQWKINKGPGSGGHNGIRDISKHFQTDFIKIKIGIGRPATQQVNDFVLSNFEQEEKTILKSVLKDIENNFERILKE